MDCIIHGVMSIHGTQLSDFHFHLGGINSFDVDDYELQGA